MSEVSLYKPLHRICRRATPGRLRLLRTTCLGDNRIVANPSSALAWRKGVISCDAINQRFPLSLDAGTVAMQPPTHGCYMAHLKLRARTVRTGLSRSSETGILKCPTILFKIIEERRETPSAS